jgi:hypothetical protein
VKPFFSEDDFMLDSCNGQAAADIANAKVAPLVDELEKLKTIFITTEHGNEFEMVLLLKEENERLKEDLERQQNYCLGVVHSSDARIVILESALKGLLSDTQHAEHSCDEEEWCPVLTARAALAGEKKE